MPEQAPDLEALKTRVIADKQVAERFQKAHVRQWAYWYSLYRNSTDYKKTLMNASPRGRDDIKRDGQRAFGAELFIPYTFWTIETILPRLLSNSPRGLVLPRGEDTDPENVENMKLVIEAQQEHSKYKLKLMPCAKDGLMYGMGVGKTMWRKETRTIKALAPSNQAGGGVQVTQVPHTLWDDPDFASIDPWDFWWDPMGEDVESCDYVIHRTWRNNRYVKNMIASGVWNLVTEADLEEVLKGSPISNFEEVWKDRRTISGTNTSSNPTEQRNIHEIWEWHDGDQVVTLVDGAWVVKATENYWHGEKPFHIFRPTVLSHEFVGIGEIEPIVHLQNEMNTLRSQRRDAATVVLNPMFAYAEGIVDQDLIKFQPGGTIPVPGDPRELLFPIQLGDLPASGYREADEIHSDIERVSGLADQTIGVSSPGTSTATEVQYVQAAANVRIQKKTELLEEQVIAPSTNQQIALNQQKITEDRTFRIKGPEPPQPGELGAARWKWRTYGPNELAGPMEFIAEGGATSPENVPQKRNDAQIWQMLLPIPVFKQAEIAKEVLKNLGIANPEAYIAAQQPVVPGKFLDTLIQGGIPPDQLAAALAHAGVQAEPAPDQQGASPQTAPQNGQQPTQTPA